MTAKESGLHRWIAGVEIGRQSGRLAQPKGPPF